MERGPSRVSSTAFSHQYETCPTPLWRPKHELQRTFRRHDWRKLETRRSSLQRTERQMTVKREQPGRVVICLEMLQLWLADRRKTSVYSIHISSEHYSEFFRQAPLYQRCRQADRRSFVEIQMHVQAGTVPRNTQNLEKVIDSHPFTHQVKIPWSISSHETESVDLGLYIA